MLPAQASDPLKGLRDIHLPNPPVWWPPAIGWWLLTGLVLTAVCLTTILFWRHRRRTRAARQALEQLEKLEKTSDENTLAELSILLRRVALAYYPRQQVAGLQGEAWLTFLDSVGQTKAFSQGVGRQLISAPYQGATLKDLTALTALLKQWIKVCRQGAKHYV